VEPDVNTPPLPRESRDTLFLLGALAWTLLPQLTQVPPWCAALAYAALAWRAWLAWHCRPLPSRWLLVLALLGASAGTLVSHQSLLGPSAGVTLLVVMSALKTLELRARRDATVVFFLGFFLVLANFLHSQALTTALAMGIAVWWLVAALVLSHLPEAPQTPPPPLRMALGLSARLLLTGLPLVVALFLLFPRVAPLWSMPTPGVGRTGLSDELRLGDVAELAQDDTLALRLQFETPGDMPPPSQLYFRGPVLSAPSGSGWRRREERGLGQPMLSMPAASGTATGRTVRYEMTLEPLGLGVLPLLETARTRPSRPDAEADQPWWRHPEGHWPTQRPLTERIRLHASATLDTPQHDPRALAAAASPATTPADDPRWAPYLALPAGEHPRTIAWADAQRADLPATADPTHPAVLAQWLLDHIRQQPYVYTLAPGRLADDPVDRFWLDQRAGFCEHYASAVTVVLRRWGVPARIVTGYLGGEVNPLNGVLEVRQRDAHAWVEYWHGGRGWVRLDPTGAVAPERVRRGERLPAPGGVVAQTLVRLDPLLLEQVRAAWGAAEHQWNQWVLGYTPHRQQDLLAALGWDALDPGQLGRWLALATAGLAGGAAAWWGWQRHRAGRDPWLRGHDRLRHVLQRKGYDAPAHLSVLGLRDHLRAQLPEPPHPATTAFTPFADTLALLSQWRYAPPAQRPAANPAALWRAARRAARRLPTATVKRGTSRP
jgi:transglutaminase-like putative cysteine protease